MPSYPELFQRGIPNPYPLYHRLRAEVPVYRSTGVIPAWFLSRHDDVKAVAGDHRRFSHRRIVAPAVEQERDGVFWHTEAAGALFADGEEHTRARGLLAQPLDRRHVAPLRERAARLAGELIDRAQPAGQMDVIGQFAEPLCYCVMCEFVGVPDLELDVIRRWVHGIEGALDPLGGPEAAATGQQVAWEFNAYFGERIRQRRERPANDLISGMLAAEWNGSRMTEEQMLGSLIQVMQSPDSMALFVGNAVLALLRHPDQLNLLRQRPELIDNAIGESLRFDTPVLGFTRVATEDVAVRGQTIHAGELVFLLYGAANRDPARFPDPDRFDVTRADIEQFAFGHGIHTCIGAPIARMLAAVAVNTLVQRLPGLELPTDALEYRKHFILHGVNALPVRFRSEGKP
jgi:pimeloyl-[acyl-carrier protein] synthase